MQLIATHWIYKIPCVPNDMEEKRKQKISCLYLFEHMYQSQDQGKCKFQHEHSLNLIMFPV